MDRTKNRLLQQLVKQHKVVFEARPSFNYTQGEPREIGFDLVLFGTPVHPVHSPDPGSHECVQVWRDLQEIARAVLPPDDHESGSTIAPFDQLLHESAARKFRNDVALTIEVRHRNRFLDPLDASESRCINEMMKSLKALGVQEHTWDELKARRHVIPDA